jgi:hypothetical protein
LRDDIVAGYFGKPMHFDHAAAHLMDVRLKRDDSPR